MANVINGFRQLPFRPSAPRGLFFKPSYKCADNSSIAFLASHHYVISPVSFIPSTEFLEWRRSYHETYQRVTKKCSQYAFKHEGLVNFDPVYFDPNFMKMAQNKKIALQVTLPPASQFSTDSEQVEKVIHIHRGPIFSNNYLTVFQEELNLMRLEMPFSNQSIDLTMFGLSDFFQKLLNFFAPALDIPQGLRLIEAQCFKFGKGTWQARHVHKSDYTFHFLMNEPGQNFEKGNLLCQVGNRPEGVLMKAPLVIFPSCLPLRVEEITSMERVSLVLYANINHRIDFQELPRDIQLEIAEYLSIQSIFRLLRTCKSIYKNLTQSFLFNKLMSKITPIFKEMNYVDLLGQVPPLQSSSDPLQHPKESQYRRFVNVLQVGFNREMTSAISKNCKDSPAEVLKTYPYCEDYFKYNFFQKLERSNDLLFGFF